MSWDWTKLCHLARLRARLGKRELIFLGPTPTFVASIRNQQLEQFDLSYT